MCGFVLSGCANVYVAKPVDFDDFAGVIKQIDDVFASVVKVSAG